MNAIQSTALALVTLTVAGCADTPIADADYGHSVKQMIQAQTYDPAAASNPAEMPPEVTDAERVKNAIDVYRKDVAKGNTDVKKTVQFEINSN